MNNDSKTAYASQVKYVVHCNANGVCMRCSRKINAAGGKVHKRGKVEGFSRASARRYRHFLIAIDYTDAISVTLTHPDMMSGMRGPEAAFSALQMIAKFKPWLRSLVWRKEVTKAGMPHYHCVLFPAVGVDGVDAAEKLVSAWIDSCMAGWSMPSVFVEHQKAQMVKAHHDTRRPAIQVMDSACGYIRYLLDHQSKHKIIQSATGGRAWGVWLRNRLPLIEGFDKELSDVQRDRVARLLQKVSRYMVKAPCIFGTKHSRGRKSFHFGSTVYFGRRNDGNLARQVLAYVSSDNAPPVDDRMAAGRFFRRQFKTDGPF